MSKQIYLLFVVYCLFGCRTHRLGRLGASQIVSHPFFKSAKWNWDNIRDCECCCCCCCCCCLPICTIVTAPMVPDLAGDDDTTYFEELDENSVQEPEVFPNTAVSNINHIPFYSLCCYVIILTPLELCR